MGPGGHRPHGPPPSGAPPATRGPPPPGPVPAPLGFPNKRVKLSSRHCLLPLSSDLRRRAADGDYFSLLRRLAPAFAGFRFKLPEIEGPDAAAKVKKDAGISEGKDGREGLKGRRSRNGNDDDGSDLNDAQMCVAKRRISSSLCAFGGSLPLRAVSFDAPSSTPSAQVAVTGLAGLDSAIRENRERLRKETEEERRQYEEALPGRYFMKEHCISWDVELHEVVQPPSPSDRVKSKGRGKGGKAGGQGKGVVGATPKAERKGGQSGPPGSSVYCAPVTPHTPPGNGVPSGAPGDATPVPGDVTPSPGDNDGSGAAPPAPPPHGGAATPGSAASSKSKIKYRCKLCGQPKQNHTCPYRSSLVRSIGTMVYPAVNAFVSHEPGRLAPALSEMNNFTSLLSQGDASTILGGSHAGPPPPGSMPGGYPPRHGGPHGPPHGPPPRGPPYRGPPYNVPEAVNHPWAPNTPGGLSTMSSGDPNSPGSAGPTPGAPGGTPPMGKSRKRDRGGHAVPPGRTMSRTMSGPPPPGAPQLPHPSAPAGPPVPCDALFRDTMELQRAQYRTVRCAMGLVAPIPGVDGDAGCAPGNNAPILPEVPPHAYRYPHVPTPYSQRKEMGDALFALSREVPRLADSCAAILRGAREDDAWDQAVAELTTQVLVVLKCEDRDYALEGLRRHLLTLGIAC